MRPLWQKTAIASLLGAVAALGQPPFGLVIATLLGLWACFAIFQQTSSVKEAVWLGWAFGTGFFVLGLHWIVEPFMVDAARHGWLAPFAMFFLCCGLALLYAIAFGVGRWLGTAPFILAMALTGTELLRTYLFTGFPWAMQPYAWVDSVVGQAAALLGPHGLNLIIFTAMAALVWLQGRSQRLASIFALALAAVSVTPVPWRANIAADAPVVRLVQPNAAQHLKWRADMMPVFYNRQIEYTAAAEPVDLVVWPEIAVPFWLHQADEPLREIARAARGATTVIGIQRTENQRFYNSLISFDDQGSITGRYDKAHLVPFGEYMPAARFLAQFGIYGLAANQDGGFAHGAGPMTLDLGDLGKAVPLICYESIFPHLANAAPERGDMLLLLTNDAWFGQFSGPYQHLMQARMRAIEQGLPMVRVANTGVSAVIDPYGHITGSIPLNQEGYLDLPLPDKRAATLYTVVGDWPVILLVIVVLGALVTRRRLLARAD
nr:apolipoprotein N-acyltransferase [Pseudaestuariivita rosea]